MTRGDQAGRAPEGRCVFAECRMEKQVSEVTDSRYRLLLEIVQAANSHLELERVLEAIVRSVQPLVRVDGAAVLTIGSDGRVYPTTVFLDSPAVTADDDPPGNPFAGSAAEYVRDTRATLLVADMQRDCHYSDRDEALAHGVRSGIFVPLFHHDEYLGCLLYGRAEPPAFGPADARLLEELTGPISSAVANALTYREADRLRRILARQHIALREDVEEHGMFREIVGDSHALRDVLRRVDKVAATDTTVLILGETGTGKEMVARAIHRRSTRAERALVCVNCAALSPALVASELFGHERGAFTGATQRRVGRFELAAGGTLFLDEIGDLPAEVQVSLLRVLQEREFDRVGGNRPVRTDVRILAATHRDLRAAVAAGSFREDLFYRLNVLPITLPPLRERREDIPDLIEHFARIHSARRGLQYVGVETESLDRMLRYDWPGNVRELENVVERATILSDGGPLRIEDGSLPLLVPSRADAQTWVAPETAASGDLRAGIRALEIQLIESALQESQGQVAGRGGAASRLGIPPATLDNKIRVYRIDKSKFLPKP
jgi:formate hydrogenlyase transcriptional activator